MKRKLRLIEGGCSCVVLPYLYKKFREIKGNMINQALSFFPWK